MKRTALFLCLAIVALMSACTADDTAVMTERLACSLRLDASKPSFDAQTRAEAADWSNGDCVYLTFYSGTECVSGKAVYNAAESSWMLEYDKPLQATESSRCQAYYFEGDYTDNGRAVALNPTTCVYYDTNGTYKKDAYGITVRADLFPMSGRVRFTGAAGTRFTVSGATTMTGFNRADATFNISGAPLATAVTVAGNTPYLYMSFADDVRTLEVTYDRLAFSRYCDRPILDAGQSGYMTVPTKDKHNGWTMQETTAPVVGATTVSDIETNSAKLTSTIVSNGNAPVSDCGFCYSLTANPTVSNMTVSCGAATTSFSTTITELKKNTTYYVRAYATNEIGTEYGEETSFTTEKGVIAVTNGLVAYYQFEDNFDDSSNKGNDGYGVSDPKFVDGMSESKAVQFNGKNSMCVGESLIDTKTHSVSLWLKDPEDGNIFAVVSSYYPYKGPIMKLSMEDGKLHYVIASYSNNYHWDNTGKFSHPDILDGKWHHVAIVCDFHVTKNYNWTTVLYIDGKKVDSVTENENGEGAYTVGTGLSFQLSGTTNLYQGTKTLPAAPMTMDNFRAYTRCLSADEVKTIYNSEKE